MKLRNVSRRRRVIIVSLVVGLMAAVVYAWMSVAVWKDYGTQLRAEQADYESLQEQALNGASVTERQKAIRRLDDKMAIRDRLCDVSALYAWQSAIIPAVREGVEKCEAKRRQLDTLAGPVHMLRSYIDTAEAVRAAILNLTVDDSLTEKNWVEKGQERAGDARAALEQVKARDDEAKALVQKARGLVDDLAEAWDSLLSAHTKKDKVAYLTATEGLARSYANLGELADMTDQAVSDQASDLTDKITSIQ